MADTPEQLIEKLAKQVEQLAQKVEVVIKKVDVLSEQVSQMAKHDEFQEKKLANGIAKLQIKKEREKKTLYWGVEVDAQLILNHAAVKRSLESNKDLHPLTKMHSTLLYVGRKDNIKEQEFFKHEGKPCKVIITGHGVSNDALCLHISSLIFTDDGTDVPTYATEQHITTALRSGVKAVDSVKALSDGSLVKYYDELILTGAVKRYFY